MEDSYDEEVEKEYSMRIKNMYRQDLKTLRDAIPEIRTLGDKGIIHLYSTWSEDKYCASWLVLNNQGIEFFRNWVLSSPLDIEVGKQKETKCRVTIATSHGDVDLELVFCEVTGEAICWREITKSDYTPAMLSFSVVSKSGEILDEEILKYCDF